MHVTVYTGIPASGKSTMINQIASSHTFVYSTDDELMLIAGEQGKTYREIFTDENHKLAAARADAKLTAAIANENPVIWDQTNVGMGKRKSILNNFDHKWFKACMCMLPPGSAADYERLLRRLHSRPGKEIPMRVIIGMLERYQMPTITEGFDHIQYFDGFRQSFETDIREISRRFLWSRQFVLTWKAENPEEVKA